MRKSEPLKNWEEILHPRAALGLAIAVHLAKRPCCGVTQRLRYLEGRRQVVRSHPPQLRSGPRMKTPSRTGGAFPLRSNGRRQERRDREI